MFDRKILLVKRSQDLKLYPGYWNGISGFLDDHQSLAQKVMEELKEELGLSRASIVRLAPGPVFNLDQPRYHKTWIIHPVLVVVNTEKIRLNEEAVDCAWVIPKVARTMKLLPGFDRVLDVLLSK